MYWIYPDARYYYSWYEEVPGAPTDGQIKAAVVDQLRVNRFTKDDDLKVDVKQGVGRR
jgi:hypothetical protein